MKVGDVVSGCTCVQISVNTKGRMLVIWVNKTDPDSRKHYGLLCAHVFDASDDELIELVNDSIKRIPEYLASVN